MVRIMARTVKMETTMLPAMLLAITRMAKVKMVKMMVKMAITRIITEIIILDKLTTVTTTITETTIWE